MPASALRPRSATEIVDAAFQVLRAHFAQFALCSALAYLPTLAVSLLVVGDPRRFQTADPQQVSELMMLSFKSGIISLLTYTVLTAVLTVAASQAYLGEEVDIGSSVRRALPRLWAVLASSILVWMLMGLAAIFLLVPAIYVAVRYFASSTAALLEDKGPLAALGRSSELSKGRKWHIFVTLLLALLIYFVLFFGLYGVTAMFGGFVLQTVAGAIATVVLYPVVVITLVLLYYDARIQSEGLDIELMADAMDPASLPLAT